MRIRGGIHVIVENQMIDSDLLNFKEQRWLIEMGGRDYSDVLVDIKGKYVEMVGKRSEGKYTLVKVYIPTYYSVEM